MIKNNLFFYLVISFVLLGCNSKKNENDRTRLAEMEEFTYKFSMESVGNYKVDFQLNPDSTFQIEQQDYFFDRYAKKSSTNSRLGTLSSEEFAKFDKLIRESDLYSLVDSYGFDENSDNSIVYLVELHSGDDVKYVSINVETEHRFSNEFTELIEFTTMFMNSKLVD
ncbi:MAG: hypothetical protein ITF98_04020 [Fermentimonas sp.]|nr:hypothetical protein [Fermentimonas sp.]